MAIAPALQHLHGLLTNGPLPYIDRDGARVCLAHELPFSGTVRLNPPSGYPDIDLALAARDWPNAALYDIVRYVKDPDDLPPAREAVRACPKCREEAFARYPEIGQRYANCTGQESSPKERLQDLVWGRIMAEDLRERHPDMSDERIEEILRCV